MNTGVQRSGATPPAARTATTQAGRRRARQRLRPGQERAADRDGARDPLRGHRDGRRPARPRGQGRARDGVPRRALPPRLRALPARLGLARRATRSGSRGWPRRPGCSRSSRPSTARSSSVSKIRRPVPVEEYLQARSGATRTCSASTAAPDVIARIQAIADRNIARFGLLDDGGRPTSMDKPFAITLDVGSSLANKTGTWRTERAVYVDRLPPCNHACPAGENIQAVALPRRGGRRGYERGLAPAHGGQPVPGDHGARLLPPVRDRLQPRPARRGGRHQLGRALPRRRGDQAAAGRSSRRAEPTGKRVLVVGAGPVRAVGRLPPARASATR